MCAFFVLFASVIENDQTTDDPFVNCMILATCGCDQKFSDL